MHDEVGEAGGGAALEHSTLAQPLPLRKLQLCGWLACCRQDRTSKGAMGLESLAVISVYRTALVVR